MDTQALIRELRDIYVSKYPECEEKIGQGYSLAQIESAITKIRPIPKALIDLYSCVGGENSDLDDCHDFLVQSYYLVSLNDIDSYIELFEELRLREWVEYFKDMSETEFYKVATWKPDMIPFLEDGCGWAVVLRILSQIILTSCKTFMNIVDKTYLEILDRILTEGTRETNRTGTDTVSLFGLSYRLPVTAEAFPILTHKKIQWRSLVTEMIWYLSGEPHIRNLQQHTKIWDAWSDIDGNLETAYGRFWRYYPVPDYAAPIRREDSNYLCNGESLVNLTDSKYRHDLVIDAQKQIVVPCFDQLRWAIDELKRNPRSRRLHITAWYPPNATISKLPPCHHSFALNYQGGKLNLHLQQRSSDHCVGNPFNLTCYSLLLLLICREVNLEPGDFYHSITDAHIYVNHIEPYRNANREAYELPQLDLSQLGDRSMFDLTYDDIDRIQLVNYQHGAFIKLPVAV